MMEWFEKLDSTKKMVVNYLRDYPHTRDSDKELFFMILRDYYRAIPTEQRSQREESFLALKQKKTLRPKEYSWVGSVLVKRLEKEKNTSKAISIFIVKSIKII